VTRRLEVDIALLHVGDVRFPVPGPLRCTLTAQDVVAVRRLLRPRTVIPTHNEG
jgi:L-ascorbate metabolism protein UlaG (beta-lactamase superfamily)